MADQIVYVCGCNEAMKEDDFICEAGQQECVYCGKTPRAVNITALEAKLALAEALVKEFGDKAGELAVAGIHAEDMAAAWCEARDDLAAALRGEEGEEG